MKKINWVFALLMMLIMVGLAELLGEKEIIFPEIIALVIGAWVLPKQPWQVNKTKLVLLMSLSSIVGVLMVRYVPLPIFFQMAIAFLFVACSLFYSQTTLVPMISACILPILLGTTSWIYPLAVISMSLIIVTVQYALEKLGLRPTYTYVPCESDFKEESQLWLKRLTYLMIMALIPCSMQHYYWIAPPLIVVFVELTHLESPARKCPTKVIGLITLAALIGTLLKLGITETLGLPLTLTAVLATLIVLIAMEKLQLFLPPAGAIAILPMILPSSTLYIYPLEVCVGVSLFTLIALKCFKASEPEFLVNLED